MNVEKMLRVRSCYGCDNLKAGCYCKLMSGGDNYYIADHDAAPPGWCKLEDAPRWVSVASGELPKRGELVAVRLADGDQVFGWLQNDGFNHWRLRALGIVSRVAHSEVTHWLAGMPALPSEEAQ